MEAEPKLICGKLSLISDTKSNHFSLFDHLISIFFKPNFTKIPNSSINDVKTYKSLGYKAIVIGDKGIINKKFDPKICEWLKNN